MSLVSAALSVLVDVPLGMWLGSMVFFSFVGAPTTFDVLGSARAGDVVNATFPTYYLLGVGYGLVALAAAIAQVLRAGQTATGLLLVGSTGVGVALFAYSRWRLIPLMEAAGADAFEQYHRRSVLLNAAAMLAVAVGLLASHAPR